MANNQQNGSIEAAAVVMLIGALGWIFWQNFTQKHEDTSSAVVTIEQGATKDDTSSAINQEGAVQLPGYGVEAVSSESKTVFTAQRDDFHDGFAYDILTSLAGCWNVETQSYETEAALHTVGKVSRYLADDKISKETARMGSSERVGETWGKYWLGHNENSDKHGPIAKQLGRYVYVFAAPQAACGESEVSGVQQGLTYEFRRDYFANLRLISQ